MVHDARTSVTTMMTPTTTSDSSTERLQCASGITNTDDLVAFIVNDVLERPTVMHFAEILALDNVQALKGTPHGGAVYDALEIFAFGTFQDYQSRGSTVPPLTTKQENKLKQLTVCSACGDTRTSLSYDKLSNELGISSIRELEDFLIDQCLFTGTVRGKLDPKNKCFHVHGAADRDVPLSQLDDIIASVSRWHGISEAMLENLTAKINWGAEEKAKAVERDGQIKLGVEELRKLVENNTEAGSRQELDDMDEDGKSVGAKRRR